jgi:TRAP-type C4-dicarboxylate transport system substrate-binding protein
MLIVCCLLSLAFNGAASAQTSAPKKVQITWVSFAKLSGEWLEWQDFIKRVEAKSNGNIVFKYLGANEVINTMDQFETVRRGGIADITGMPADFAIGSIPEAGIHALTKNTMVQVRENGLYDLMNQIYHKNNIHWLKIGQSMADTGGSRIWLKKKVEKIADLKGVKIRSSAAYLDMLKTVGASPIMLATGDIYTAAERNVIDGFVIPLAEIYFTLSLNEVSKFYIDPGFSRPTMSLYMNFGKWKQLSPEQQKLIDDTMMETEKEWVSKWGPILDELPAKLEKTGITRVVFSPEDKKKLVESYYDTAWEAAKKWPNYDPKMRALTE